MTKLNKVFSRITSADVGIDRVSGLAHAGAGAASLPAFGHCNENSQEERAAHGPSQTIAPSKPQQDGSVSRSASRDASKLSPTLAVIGAKGGCGATTIAINLASAIALRRLTTTLLDAHFQLPTIAHALGIEPQHSLMEL